MVSCALRSSRLRLGSDPGWGRFRQFGHSPGRNWPPARRSLRGRPGGLALSGSPSRSSPQRGCILTIRARLGRSHPRCLGVGTTPLSPSRSGSASSLGGGQRLRGLAFSALCPRRLEPGCGGVEVQEQGLGSWQRPLDRGRGSRTRSTGSAHACGSASPSAAGARDPAAATSAAETQPRRLPPAARVGSARSRRTLTASTR